jgi:hypothetical protein
LLGVVAPDGGLLTDPFPAVGRRSEDPCPVLCDVVRALVLRLVIEMNVGGLMPV